MSKSTTEIREEFLDFFYNKGHKLVASSCLIPKDDPTLLFTNAGMNQFKDIFLGLNQEYDCSRVATSQHCVRAGGKHSDLESVGYNARHHTFFEMLGNFSFGDYFKYEAIQYAWELLTSKKFFNLSKDKLWITVYKTDNETYEIWEKNIGVSRKHIIRIGDNKDIPYTSDNFWQMGNTGPCGPCTEIFYDHGDHISGGLPGSNKKIGDRYMEIWNIVFMQFNRKADNTMEPLPKPSVDTGMGLERIAAVIQHVDSNYDIDLFRKLIKSTAKIIGITDLNNKPLRVIADHIRSCSFLIADGVIPSNENRGYVLRRIIRRAIRHGNILGAKETFFYKLVEPLIEVMDKEGEKLKHQQALVEQILKNEEEQFNYTLGRGLSLLKQELMKLSISDTLDGEIIFRLYDTYGLPIDLTAEVCQEHNIKIDKNGFHKAMQKQQYRARKHHHFNTNHNVIVHVNYTSEFHGYDHTELNSHVIALFVGHQAVDSINVDQEAIVIIDKTPFYAESEDQIGDQGELKGNNFSFKVHNTKKYCQTIYHIGKLIFGTITIGDAVQANVDKERRIRISSNHSATHLMYAALREVLGAHVLQKGSLINDALLRFDFYHFKEMKPLEIRIVENLVNTQIRRNLLIKSKIIKTSKVKNIQVFSNKKCNELVRLLTIGDFSKEPCNGTHALRTGDIGLFRIISESAITAGIRRIEAVTGEIAVSSLHKQSDQINNISQLLNCNAKNLEQQIHNLLKHIYKLEYELQQLKERTIIQEITNLSTKAIDVKDIKLLVSILPSIEPKILRSIIDKLKNKLGSAVVLLATVTENKISIIAWVSKNITDRLDALRVINRLIKQIGGKGGGGIEIAYAGSKNINALPIGLSNVKHWIKEKL